jgi:hypothetical protein
MGKFDYKSEAVALGPHHAVMFAHLIVTFVLNVLSISTHLFGIKSNYVSSIQR